MPTNTTAKRATTKRAAAKRATTESAATKRAATKRPTAKRAAPAKRAATTRAPAKGAAKRATTTKRATAKRAADNYTDPALRERLKDEILAGDKGGRPGQWSARKAQLLAHAYEAAGGGYRGEKTETQRHLDAWTREEWTTADGRPARRGATTARYLPKRAWEELSPAERRSTDEAKRAASKRGQQFVANTGRAAAARRHATEDASPGETERSTTTKRSATKRPAAKRPAARAGRAGPAKGAARSAAKSAAKRTAKRAGGRS